MRLFVTVSDPLQNNPEGDSGWLDAAEATLSRCGEQAREPLLETLRIIDCDYHLPRAQERGVSFLASCTGAR